MDKEFLFQKFDVSKKGARSSEFRKIFSKIKDSMFANVKVSNNPVFVFATGPSDAGKTGLEVKIECDFPKQKFITLDIDEFRVYHPDIKEVLSDYWTISADLTTSFAKDVRDELLTLALKQGYSVIFSASINRVEKAEKMIADIPKSYQIGLYAVITHPLEYRLTAEERYEREVFRKDFVPRCPDENYMKKCDNFVKILPSFMNLVDFFKVYRRLPSLNYLPLELVCKNDDYYSSTELSAHLETQTPRPDYDTYFSRLVLLLNKRTNRANVTEEEIQRIFSLYDMYFSF